MCVGKGRFVRSRQGASPGQSRRAHRRDVFGAMMACSRSSRWPPSCSARSRSRPPAQDKQTDGKRRTTSTVRSPPVAQAVPTRRGRECATARASCGRAEYGRSSSGSITIGHPARLLRLRSRARTWPRAASAASWAILSREAARDADSRRASSRCRPSTSSDGRLGQGPFGRPQPRRGGRALPQGAAASGDAAGSSVKKNTPQRAAEADEARPSFDLEGALSARRRINERASNVPPGENNAAVARMWSAAGKPRQGGRLSRDRASEGGGRASGKIGKKLEEIDR